MAGSRQREATAFRREATTCIVNSGQPPARHAVRPAAVLVLSSCGSHCCSVPGADVEELCFVVMGPKISGDRAAVYHSHQRTHTPGPPAVCVDTWRAMRTEVETFFPNFARWRPRPLSAWSRGARRGYMDAFMKLGSPLTIACVWSAVERRRLWHGLMAAPSAALGVV
eukprot:scaffold22351_cov66-Phaeocystis_antarctica.AAC.3